MWSNNHFSGGEVIEETAGDLYYKDTCEWIFDFIEEVNLNYCNAIRIQVTSDAWKTEISRGF